ncbi:MAG TPA: ATP synthase F0 subunit C [Holophagaceae bacterium]|jgi:F-type H+-transporting ATPase subunit c|nr:ATP synthase F0 subunit C [Holophagaceae bacterium]
MKKFLKTAALFTACAAAFAQQPDAAAAVAKSFDGHYLAHVALGLAALGGGIGMGTAIGSACEGIARNPQASGTIRTTMILGLAFIESIVLYVFALAFAIK